jgi:diguanylate cyclase (GGDEF)-like protein/PAS domain S-box-containing protein
VARNFDMDSKTDRIPNGLGLQTAAQRFRQLADWAPVSIAIFDLNMRYLALTQGWRDDCQIGDRDVIGLSHYEVFPDLPEQWKDVHRRCLIGATERSDADHFLRPDGTSGWIRWEVKPWRDDFGNIGGIVMWTEDITKRKQVEEELCFTKNHLRSTLDAIPDLVFEVDAQGQVLNYHAHSNDLLAAPPEVFMGKNFADVLPLAATEVCMRAIKEAASKGWSAGAVYALPLQQGETWFELSAAAMPVIGDVEPHFILLTRDITERKKAEDALVKSNAQLQLLETCVARLHDIVLITEAEPTEHPGPRILYVNDAFVRRTGFSREEVIGKTPRILQGPKTQRNELDRIGAALKRWEPVRAELINYTKTGQEFWIELDIVPVADAAGRFTHWVAVERDITERKLAEASLLESESRHRSMFENNPQPMWVFDTETLAFLSVNEAAVNRYGYSREEFSRMTIRDIRPAEEIARFDTYFTNYISRPSSYDEVWTHLRKDGSKRQVEINSHAIDFQGRPAELILVNDVTDKLTSQAKVEYLAYHDTLTGLPNRTQFMDFANNALRDHKFGSNFRACILFDLDNFKSINDHWGHRVGDEMLKQVALRVQQCLSPAAFLARLGGDEFIVFMVDVGRDQAAASLAAQNLCNKIIVTLAVGFTIDQREHFTSASLGISLFGGTEMKVDELLSRADSAMYSAKAEGRNTFRFFDGQLQAQLAAQSELEGDLRQSVQNNELYMVYQPQVDQLGRIVGSEALLRWNHPQRGLVSPAEFIPAAEGSGFILQIGQWVLHTACLALAKWQSEVATAGLKVAVNVSAKQFHHPDFVSQVLSALELSGANPALLKLELTESLLAQDLNGIVQKMNALKAKGVTFSLDDFGTGYSSLAYLKRLPLDQLKIDQGFVRDLLVDASDAAIVRTVIALGNTLGLNVIAEGVETQAQREFLESYGCYSYQGYLFSRPLKQEDFEAFCARA